MFEKEYQALANDEEEIQILNKAKQRYDIADESLATI